MNKMAYLFCCNDSFFMSLRHENTRLNGLVFSCVSHGFGPTTRSSILRSKSARKARRVKQTTQCVVCSQSVSGFVIREGTVGSNPCFCRRQMRRALARSRGAVISDKIAVTNKKGGFYENPPFLLHFYCILRNIL